MTKPDRPRRSLLVLHVAREDDESSVQALPGRGVPVGKLRRLLGEEPGTRFVIWLAPPEAKP